MDILMYSKRHIPVTFIFLSKENVTIKYCNILQILAHHHFFHLVHIQPFPQNACYWQQLLENNLIHQDSDTINHFSITWKIRGCKTNILGTNKKNRDQKDFTVFKKG